MIYKNVRPFAIEIVNTVLNERYIIQPQGLTPNMPEGLENGSYAGTLIPLVSESRLVRGVGERDSELFETENTNDGFFESEENDGELIPLNEQKRGRGRPKKI